jgi:hypothetical protein
MKKIAKLTFFYLKVLQFTFDQVGINVLKFKKLLYFIKYFSDLIKYKKMHGKVDFIFPVLGEDKKKSGHITNHYFYQDLLVASYIFKNKPAKHVDIGSRIDGFIANVASFRKIEVFDLRVNKLNFKNIKFKKLNLNNINKKLYSYADSISCLHTIEHFGLGRYGDKIDPDSYKNGFKNLIKILKVNGLLYISFPISDKNQIFFNLERRFNAKDILSWSKELVLLNFDYIDDKNKLNLNVDLFNFKKKNITNGCGIYIFKKIKSN